MMSNSPSMKMAAFLMALLLALSTGVQAAEKKDKAARRMQQMMQKMQREKAELQAQFDQEKAALEAKVKASEETAGEAQSSLAVANRKARGLAADLESLRKEKADLQAMELQTEATLLKTQGTLAETKQKLADLQQQYQTAQREIQDGNAQRKELLANLSKKGQQAIACQEKNARLHDFGLQLVKIYDKPSTYEQVMRTEPFVQAKRVELENILQDYRDKLDGQVVTSSSQ